MTAGQSVTQIIFYNLIIISYMSYLAPIYFYHLHWKVLDVHDLCNINLYVL